VPRVVSRETLANPDDMLPRALVAWYGVYQAAHIVVNTRGLYILHSGGTLDFPAPPPPSGWPAETIHMILIMGWADLVGAFLALFFVYGYLRRARWRMWLGTLTLTISVYAAVIFNYWSIASGAWTGRNLLAYSVVNVGFLPVLVLFYLFCRWGARGVFRDAASDA
jgi:hypothetical protein